MKIFNSVFILLVLIILLPEKMVAAPLSQNARISMLTCAPGDALYSYFGHCAIRVEDPDQDLDIVFNWGTFDFATPNFYSKFVRGRLNYMLSLANYIDFKTEYILEKRSIYEQDLLLTAEEKQALFDKMLINYQPENRFYLYDFFFDNCATRIRDIIDISLENRLTFHDSKYRDEVSFRQLLDPYIEHDPWLDLGIDLVLGVPADKIARPVEYMFLPDFLMEQFIDATLGEDRLIAGEVKTLYQSPERDMKPINWGPNLIFWFLVAILIVVTLVEYWQGRRYIWIDKFYFSILGLLGWFLVFLWLGTDHVVMEKNLDLIWALPFYFPVALLLRRGGKRNWISVFFTITFCIHFLTLLLFPLFHHMVSIYIFPLILIATLRSYLYSRFYYWQGWIEFVKKNTR